MVNEASTELTAGSRWVSSVCEVEVIVVREPDGPGALGCGGEDMVPHGSTSSETALDPSLADGTLLGKRYTDEASGLEVLCTKDGSGTLTFRGQRLEVKSPKSLPASD